MTGVSELLSAYDTQLRGREPTRLPAGVSFERDGPLIRFVGFEYGGFIGYRDLAGLDGDDLDELIERQVRFFAERGERFEWKVHGHDRPTDLPQRLLAAGFEPEDEETVVIATVAEVAGAPVLPEGTSLREVVDRAGLDRIAAFEARVWGGGDDHGALADDLDAERAADPDGLSIFVVEAGAEIVCAAWIRFDQGTDFASLWGGATLPEWRRRGIYRATVAYRAGLAAERGFRYLSVDASSDSRPILERLGFVPVTTTTPYIWSPRAT